MKKFKELHLMFINEWIISQFPLEQVEKFVLSDIKPVKDFPKFSHRLKSLKELYLALLYVRVGEPYVFTARQHPFHNNLTKLSLRNFSEIDLTGFIKLKHC
jgi:hypothetical protein